MYTSFRICVCLFYTEIYYTILTLSPICCLQWEVYNSYGS